MLRLLKDKAMSLKLKSKLMLSFMLTSVFILLLFAFIFYRYTANTLLEQSEKSTLRSLTQLESNLTHVLDTVNTVSRSILVSSYFSDELNLDEIDSSADVRLVNDVYSYFTELMTNYEYIHSIVYYGDNGIIIGSSNQKNFFQNDRWHSNFFYQSSFYDDIKTTDGPVLCGGFNYKDFFPGSSFNSALPRYISLGRKLKTIQNTTGYVIVNIQESYMRSLYHDDSKKLDGESMLLDAHSRIISAADKSLIGTTAKMQPLDSKNAVSLALEQGDNKALNENNQIIYYPYQNYGLSIIHEVPFNILFKDINKLKALIAWLLILFVILALVISMFWIYSITRPLNALISAMKTMGSGQIGVRMDEARSSDFGFLTYQFNQMSQNIQTLVRENQVIQEERHELALQNLQNQLNPHFLYNTLNTIKWMAIVSKADNIAQCVTALGNMLQPLFRNTKTTWCLKEELQYLTNYLCIMNYRTGEPIAFSSDIAPEILNCPVPKLLLQPLVENAITYSNPSTDVKNSITLTGVQKNGVIYLLLKDNGLGISPDKLSVLQNLLASHADCTTPLDRSALPEGIGIGILNISRRIKLQYGNAYGLTVDSEEGKGTAVTITLIDSPEAHFPIS